jgi:hypothetical protein
VTAMIKKSFIAVVTILLLVTSILAAMQVEFAEANMVPISWIKINSPVSSTTYQNTTVPLEVYQGNNAIAHPLIQMTYSLDSGPTIEITNVTRSANYSFFDYKVADYTGRTALENLEPGNHSLVVYTVCEHTGGRTAKVEFAVANPPTSTPTVPEFSWLAIFPLLASILLVALATKQFMRLSTLF